MPWRQTCAMKERQEFVRAVQGGNESISRLCQQFGVSRKTGYKWLSRYNQDGDKGLDDRRHLRVFPRTYSDAVFETILSVRAQHPSWGPLKLKYYLELKDPDEKWPSASTIKDFLRRHGISKYKKRFRSPILPASRSSRMMTESNAMWCADFKGWFRTKDGRRCEPLTILDGYSRFLLVCKIVGCRRFNLIRDIFSKSFKEYGLPDAILTDNGPPFGSHGLCSLSPLSVWLIKQGIYPEKIRPGHPEDNGRQERFHKTLKKDATRPPSESIREQQKRFDIFRKEYNEDRPHESLDNMPPARFYGARNRFPRKRYEYNSSQKVVRVNSKGYIKFKGHGIYLTESLASEDIGIGPVEEQGYLLVFLGYPLGYLQEQWLGTGQDG